MMLLRESGFTFNGLHSRTDMGLIYAEKDGHVAIPAIRRSAYEIAGHSGTVLLEGEIWQTMEFAGTLYPAEERATQAEAQELLRRVAAWLTAGRCPLIFDYEPDVFYLAELSRESAWSLKNWFGGEIGVTFEAQPYAYSLTETTASKTLTGTSGTLTLNLETGHDAPLNLTIANQGTATIKSVAVGSGIKLEGLSLAAGQTLTISMEAPIGAAIGTESALPCATRFDLTRVSSGRNTIQVGLTYGSGTKKALVTARARGRW